MAVISESICFAAQLKTSLPFAVTVSLPMLCLRARQAARVAASSDHTWQIKWKCSRVELNAIMGIMQCTALRVTHVLLSSCVIITHRRTGGLQEEKKKKK